MYKISLRVDTARVLHFFLILSLFNDKALDS